MKEFRISTIRESYEWTRGMRRRRKEAERSRRRRGEHIESQSSLMHRHAFPSGTNAGGTVPELLLYLMYVFRFDASGPAVRREQFPPGGK